VEIQVRELAGMDEVERAVDVFRTIWGFRDAAGPINAELIQAFTLAGGYLAGAFGNGEGEDDGDMIGASVGFLGYRDGHVHLHSHISGVVPAHQGRHVGLALKLHQRDWCLERGIDTVEWTFDPLIRRNAFFNLVKLGATVVDFKPDFYGDMPDAINAGDPTDRAVVEWDLRAPTKDRDRDGPAILRAADDGEPVAEAADGEVLRAWIPEDAVALRQRDPDTGRAWRLALRDTFGAAVADGYRATSMTRDGWYTLEREPEAKP
jgi:predicted GNAT superfamily acetyltransferase